MDRTEAKKAYSEKVAGYLQEGMELLQKNWEEIIDEVKQTIFHGLYQLFLHSDSKEQIRYLQISLLRSQMDDDVYGMLLSLHNESYFLDPSPCMQKVDVSMIFTPLKEIRSELYQAVGEYQGRIEYFDADRLIRETAMTFYKKRADDCRGIFRDLELWRAEKGLSPWKQLIVKWGGFEEESETIYLIDKREKSQAQFLVYNEKNSITQWNVQYVYQSWETIKLSDIKIQKMNLLFIMLRNCKLDCCQWENCMMHGAEFQNSELKQVIFAGCDLSGSDFRNVEFDRVQFIQCNLTGADFTNATFNMIEFPGSQMENAKFSRNGLYCKGLDANQLQQVRLEEESYVF